MKNIILYYINNTGKWLWIEYRKIEKDNLYEVIYGYQSEINFCKYCGSINYKCGCKSYKLITKKEVSDAINSWNIKEN